MNKVFIKCPACGDGLYATQLSCNRCDTTVQGSFSLSAFDRLSADRIGAISKKWSGSRVNRIRHCAVSSMP